WKKKPLTVSVAYADNTFLPLRRRRAKTLRPFFVLIRLRKPCTFFRLREFGWYVRFIDHTPPERLNKLACRQSNELYVIQKKSVNMQAECLAIDNALPDCFNPSTLICPQLSCLYV